MDGPHLIDTQFLNVKKETTSLNPLLNLAFVCFSCGVALFVVFSPQQHAAAAHGPRTLGGGETGVVFGIQSGGFQTAPACPGPTQTSTGAVSVALGARLGRFRAKLGCRLRPRRDRAAGLCSSLFSRWRMYACGLGLTTYIFGSLRAAHPGPFRNTQHTGLLNRRPGLSGVAVRRASASRRSPTAAFEDRSRGPRLRLSPPFFTCRPWRRCESWTWRAGGAGTAGRSGRSCRGPCCGGWRGGPRARRRAPARRGRVPLQVLPPPAAARRHGPPRRLPRAARADGGGAGAGAAPRGPLPGPRAAAGAVPLPGRPPRRAPRAAPRVPLPPWRGRGQRGSGCTRTAWTCG